MTWTFSFHLIKCLARATSGRKDVCRPIVPGDIIYHGKEGTGTDVAWDYGGGNLFIAGWTRKQRKEWK